jgi:diphthamide biosynthesis protein 3
MSTTTIQTSTRTTLTASSPEPSSSTSKSADSKQPAKDEDLDIYDEIEIEDMTFDETLQIYHYPCPCGDRFEIQIDSLRDGEDIAVCPGCSLTIRVIFDVEDLPKKEGEEAKKG